MGAYEKQLNQNMKGIETMKSRKNKTSKIHAITLETRKEFYRGKVRKSIDKLSDKLKTKNRKLKEENDRLSERVEHYRIVNKLQNEIIELKEAYKIMKQGFIEADQDTEILTEENERMKELISDLIHDHDVEQKARFELLDENKVLRKELEELKKENQLNLEHVRELNDKIYPKREGWN